MQNKDKTCSFVDCSQPVRCAELCRTHYAAARRERVRSSGSCRTCGNPVHSRGMCEYHYRRFIKSADARPEIERAQRIAAHPLRKKWYAAVASGVVEEWGDFETFCRDVGLPPNDGKYFLRKKFVGELLGPENFRWAARRTMAEAAEIQKLGRRRAYYSKQIDGDPVYTRSARNSILKRNFGITVDDYDIMLEAQNGVCAICSGTCNKRLAVDHCHVTSVVRGLLCQSCNLSLGRMADDPARLRKAADYLEAHTKIRRAA